jgi:redox-sensitive bicupin YhaK (pirin superfamily)
MITHLSNSRGMADHGWLQSAHTFSFADYYNPERMSFGTLRVINDDVIAAGSGFGRHPHRDMEIITIPTEGSLKHQDSEGNHGVIGRGEVQVMSAGTGIFHSEHSDESLTTKLLQIWVMPKKLGVPPIYDQKKFPLDQRKDSFQLVVSPDGRDGSLAINQDAFFSLAELSNKKELTYTPKISSNGAYLFILSGNFEVNGETFSSRDGIGFSSFEKIYLKTSGGPGEILIMEIPMIKT